MSVVIDLSQTDTKPFKSENLIQVEAKKIFGKLIDNFLTAIKDDNTQIDCCKTDGHDNNNHHKIDRVHNTILINGKRGMGKTSFILSIENAKKDEKDEKILRNICSLGIIDPTLIETKEHVLLNIITLIKDNVDDYMRCQKCDFNASQYKGWKESLKKLAGGLCMLDGVGADHLKDNTLWDSPELILEKGLSNAKQGVDLEKNFHSFINESLKIIDKKAFFLILDDIDTSLDKGVDILEILRKYLTSRKLIITMLGDIDLYSTLVRQLQWQKMDSKKILKDYEFTNNNKEVYVSQIEHLEEQYLTKVLKPENRIDLQNLLKLKDSLSILISNDSDKKTKPFIDYIEEMINKIYLTKKSGYSKYFQNALLKQSTRSVLQILHAWDKNGEKNNYAFITSIKHTFYTTIKKKLELHNLLEMPLKEEFFNLLSMYILNENISRDNHLKLIPEFPKDDDNVVMLYLNAMANNIIVPNDYLAYFIKVGYVLEQFLNIDKKQENEIEYFTDHIALDSGESSSKIAKRLISISSINTNTRQSPILLGSVFISQNNLKQIDKKENISLLLSRVNGSTFGQYNFLSFFNLIGFMSDIVSNIENQDEAYINNQQILEFVLYKDKNLGGEIDADESSYNIEEKLIKELRIWSSNVMLVQKLPLFVLAKIWIRTSYTFSNISKNKFENYYKVLEMFVAGFLNAIYVEVNLYNKGHQEEIDNFSIRNADFMKNPDKDSEFYYNKIKTYAPDPNLVTFYDYISQCPLFKRENNRLKYFNSLEKVTFKINFMDLEADEQLEILEDIIKKHRISKVDLKKYSTLTETQKDNFITNRFRNKTTEYNNIGKKVFEELLTDSIK
ncbi:hypothetical protein [Sulfuricurvum sp.]|uniref:hypothetical protein n=1 Tax=Sulfuricurvum sp. TaxID=2025608 RepID=UPI0035633AD9